MFATNEKELIERAVQVLAGKCDYAKTRDGVGFNKPDAFYGHEIASVPKDEWNDDDWYVAWNMLSKYKQQLSEVGIDLETVQTAVSMRLEDWKDIRHRRYEILREKRRQGEFARSAGGNGQSAGVVDFDNYKRMFSISFRYNAELVALVKQIVPSAWFDREAKVWRAQPSDATYVLGFAMKHNFSFTEEADKFFREEKPQAAEEVKAITIAEPERLAVVNGENVEFRFPNISSIREDLKLIEGRRFVGDNLLTGERCLDKHWVIPLSTRSAGPIMDLINKHKFKVSDDDYKVISGAHSVSSVNYLSSVAITAEPFPIKGLNRTPFPFQWAGFHHLVRNRRCLNADDMGLGKSITSVITTVALNGAPALVICPAVAKYKWKEEVEETFPHLKATVLNGLEDQSDLDGFDFVICNYDILAEREKKIDENGNPIMQPEESGKHFRQFKASKTMETILQWRYKTIVVDEAHCIKEQKSGRTKAVLKLGERADNRYALTGTPVINRPKEIITILKLLDKLHIFGGFMKFAIRYCAYDNTGAYPVWGASNLEELNRRLRDEGIYLRRTKHDVMPQLPKVLRPSIHVDISNRAEYDKAERQFVDWLYGYATQDKKFLESIAELPEASRRQAIHDYAVSRAQRAQKAEQVTKMNYLRMLTGKGKIKAAVEWCVDAVAQGNKIIVFADHQEAQQAILAGLQKAKVGVTHIFSSDSSKERNKNVSTFQTDPKCMAIVCSLMAANATWTGTAASHMLFVEFAWAPAIHQQAEGRAHGRVNDPHGLTAYYMVARETIDSSMIRLLNQKLKMADIVTDGRMVSTELSEGNDPEIVSSVATDIANKHKGII